MSPNTPNIAKALSDHPCWCLCLSFPVATSCFTPGSCWACPTPLLLSSVLLGGVAVCTWFGQVSPMYHAGTSPHAAWLEESGDGHRGHTLGLLKGKLAATFSQGSCIHGMAILIVVPSMHPECCSDQNSFCEAEFHQHILFGPNWSCNSCVCSRGMLLGSGYLRLILRQRDMFHYCFRARKVEITLSSLYFFRHQILPQLVTLLFPP